jgi:hypothetical protein
VLVCNNYSDMFGNLSLQEHQYKVDSVHEEII